MVEHILAALTVTIVAVIAAGGYIGIAGLMAIESACIPLPSEVIMPFAGYLVSTGRFNLALAATAGAIGCNIGSAIAYAVGAYGGIPAIRRWGRYVLISPEEVDRAHRFFERWGGITVFVARLLPVVRTFIALPAGIARMPLARFHLYTFLGSWPWCFGLAWVGKTLGDRWNSDPRFHELYHQADGVIVVLVIGAAVWFFWSRRHVFNRK